MRSISPLVLAFLSLVTATDSQEAADADAFPNAHLLVTTEWVATHVANGDRVLVDTRSAGDYAAGHVPGAVNVPTSSTFLPARSGDIGTPQQIAGLLGARGIRNATHVVLYDEGRSTSAARVFWTLETFGHAQVSVVDGGFAKWQAEERDVSRDRPRVTPATYEAGEPSARLSTSERLLDDLDDERCIMLDARSTQEFDAGRIPAAVHVEWLRNYRDGADEGVSVFLDPSELVSLYADLGVTKDKRVHAY